MFETKEKVELHLELLNMLPFYVKQFKEIYEDPTIAEEDHLIRKLRQMKDRNFISEHEYNYCYPYYLSLCSWFLSLATFSFLSVII